MTPVPERRVLVLLRHARAEPAGELGDHDRPLATRGRRQASDVGARLAEEVDAFDAAVVSDALRARETYRLVAVAHGAAPAPLLRAEVYTGGPRQVLAALGQLEPDVRRVLVVGHEPTISGLATMLADELPPDAAHLGLGMATGEAAVLTTETAWDALSRGCAQLHGLVRPAGD